MYSLNIILKICFPNPVTPTSEQDRIFPNNINKYNIKQTSNENTDNCRKGGLIIG